MTPGGTRLRTTMAALALGMGMTAACCKGPPCQAPTPSEIVEPVRVEIPVARATLLGRVSAAAGPRVARIDVFRRGAFHPFVHGGYRRESGQDRYLEPPQVGEAPVATAEAGTDGAFVVAGLPLGTYDVHAESGDDVGGAVVSFEVGGERREAMILLGPTAGRVEGRSTWPDGHPFRGVLRTSTREWDNHPESPRSSASPVWSQSAATDAEGRFQFERPPRGVLWMSAYEGTTWHWQGEGYTVPRTEPFVLVVGGPEARFAGRVLDAATDRGIEGATVRTMSAGEGGWIWAKATTRADGTFEILRAGGSVDEVFVAATGFVPVSRSVIGTARRFENPFVVKLSRGARLEGRVTDADGRPVAGLQVLLEGSLTEAATTDDDGRYGFEVAGPGDRVVDVRGRGFVPRALLLRKRSSNVEPSDFDPQAVLLRPGEAKTFDVVVVKGAALRGRVLDASDRPIEGATVGIISSDEDPGFGWDGQPFPGAGITNAKGEFVHEGLLPGATYALHAAAPGFRDHERHFDRHGTGTPVEIHLEAAPSPAPPAAAAPSPAADVGSRWHAISGRVAYPDGRVTPGASVDLRGTAASSRCDAQAETDAQGAFELNVPADESLRLVARKEDAEGDWEADVAIEPGTTTVAVSLALKHRRDPKDWHVVHILDPNGRPVPRVSIRIGHEFPSYLAAEVVSGGLYEMGWTPAPHEALEIWGARDEQDAPLPLGPARFDAWESAGRDLELRLPAERLIEGTVLDPDGLAVGGVFVTAVPVADEQDPPGGFGEHARTTPNGRFRIGGLDDGAYLLRFSVPPSLFPPGRVVANGGTTGLDVRLHRPVDIPVTVRTDAGEALAGAKVTISVMRWDQVRAGWEARDWSRGDGVTDANGACVLHGIDPEELHRLRVGAPESRRRELRSIDRKDWLPRSATLSVLRTGSVAGVVKDRSGRPVPHAAVFAAQGDERRSSEFTGGDGAFRVEDLVVGSAVLMVWFEGEEVREPGAARTTAAVGSTDVALVIDPGATLVVEVDRGDARPDARDASAVLVAEGAPRRELSGWDRFEFRGLRPEVSYTLWLAPTANGRTALLDHVRAGGEPLRVTPVEGKTISGRFAPPAGTGSVSVRARAAHGNITVYGEEHEDGTYVIRDLADGRWTVHADTSGNGAVEARGEVDAGGTFDFTTWTRVQRAPAAK